MQSKLDVKAATRRAWASGDYHRFAKATVWEVGPVLVEACSIGRGQRVLDVAAGSGNVAIRAAEAGASVVAADLTPESFEAGRREAEACGVELEWVEADAEALPFPDGAFDAVTSCFGVMFVPDHGRVAGELTRVCRPGGVVTVADICVPEDPRKAARFDELEKLNDATHHRALPHAELAALFQRAGLGEPKVARYQLDYTLSRLQHALGHSREAARATEERFRAAIREGLLAGSRIEGDDTIFSYPIAVLTAHKAH